MLQSRRFITAHSRSLLFRRFDYWMRSRLDYTPIRVHEHSSNGFKRFATFEDAAFIMSRMIEEYVIGQSWRDESSSDEGFVMDRDVLSLFNPLSNERSTSRAAPRPPAALRRVRPRPEPI